MNNYTGRNVTKITSPVIKVKKNSNNHAVSMYPKDNVLGMAPYLCSPLQNPTLITKYIR